LTELDIMNIIARNEFNRVIRHPMVIVVGAIVLIIAYVNGAGGGSILSSIGLSVGQDIFMQGYGQLIYNVSFICCIMAAFLGVASMSEEYGKNSFSVTLTKPIYRRDVILGKVIGLCEFMFLFITLVVVFITTMLILGFRSPDSYVELWRPVVLILALGFESSLVVSLTVLVGSIFRNIIGGISIAITYIYVDWFRNISQYMGVFSVITPKILYLNIINPPNSDDIMMLFNTLIPFDRWFGDASMYIVLLLIEMTMLIVISCLVFTRQENL